MTDSSAAGLAEAIEAIRGELRQAQEAGRSQNVRFSVGSVEIELAVEVVKSGGGEASVKVLNLLSIGGKDGRSGPGHRGRGAVRGRLRARPSP
jgi:hypothetical protein